MKKLILCAILLAASRAHALDSISADLFPYENRAASFTVNVDAGRLDWFSLQVVYSTPTIADLPISGASISTADDTISGTNHGYATALPVLLATAATGAPTPLTTGTTYYVIKVSDNLVKLATTYAQAVANDPIDIRTATPSTGTWTLRPVALNLGTAGYLWQGSNDGVNFVNVESVSATVGTSSQTLTAMGVGQRLYNWGEYPYKYLRFVFNGPIAGVIKLRAYINAKQRN